MKHVLLILSLLFASTAVAQEVGPAPVAVDKAQPVDMLVLAKHAAPSYRVVLAPLTDADLAGMRAHNQQAKRLQVGVHRDLPTQLHDGVALDALAWQRLGDGSRVAVLELVSPDAAAMRVALDPAALPKGLAVRASAPGFQRVAHTPLTAASGGGRQWLPELQGEVMALELHAAAGFDLRGARLPLAAVAHLVVSPVSWDAKRLVDAGEADPCNLDIACHPDANWFATGAAVAKYTFSDADGLYLCTGTLMNNLSDDGAPLFLTARHCIENAVHAASMNLYWHFEREVCGGPVPLTGEFVQTTGGGQLLASTPGSLDMTLLMLNNPPSPDAILAGWDANPPARNEFVTVLHHPSGDLKKYADGQVVAITEDGGSTHDDTASHLKVEYHAGTTEQGSSGSGLFNIDYQLIATLHGGLASCAMIDEPDWYSRLDLAYPTFEPWLVDGAAANPPAPEPPVVTTLTSGASVAGTVAEAEWHYFVITASAALHDQLMVDLFGLSNDADLYVRRGALPTLNAFDCRSWNENTADEFCDHQLTGGGDWYIGVYGFDDGVAYQLVATLAEAAPLPPADDGGGGHGGTLLALAILGWWRTRRLSWTTRSSSCAMPNGPR